MASLYPSREHWRRIPRHFHLWRWGSAVGLLLLLSTLIFALLPSTVVAHATLLATSPTDGEVIDAAPQEVVLTFNEPVRPVDGGMRLFDPAGNEVELTGTTRDDQVIVPLPDDMDDGTWTFGWRVISADGHPIGGALTFSIGAPTDTAVDIAITQGSPLAERLTAIVQGLGYVGLLVAIGLTIFQHLVLRSSGPNSKIRTCVIGAAVLGGIAWLVLIPLTTVRQQGNELSSIVEASTWWAEADNTVIISSAMVASGLALLLVAKWIPDERLRQLLEVTGGVLAVVGPTLSGHTRAFTPIWMFVVSNVVHTFVGAVWLGGLIGLAITLCSHRRTEPTDRATTIRLSGMVAQFSTVAGAALGLLILTGLVSGWLVLGGVRPFVESTYGRLVLLKLGLVAIVALIAAWNRFRLVPVIVARRSREGDARRLLYRLVALEGAVLIIVAMVTGFLVNQSPPTTVVAADEADGAAMAIDLPLGSGSVIGTTSPLVPGTSTVTFQVLDEQGEPLTPQELPTVQASLPSADLGPLTGTVQETDAPATYRAELDLPLAGAWEVELIVRTSTFEEPIARFTMEIPAPEAPQHDEHEHEHGTVPHDAKEHPTGHEDMSGETGTGVVNLSITNRGDEDDSLTGGVTNRAEHIELHEQIIDDNIASMRPIEDALPIPAGETVDFDSGTLHQMLANLTEDNRAGDIFDLTLVFARAGEVTLQVSVRLGAEPMDGEPQSESVEVGSLVLEGVWSRPAPSFASASAAGRYGNRAVPAANHHSLDVVAL